MDDKEMMIWSICLNTAYTPEALDTLEMDRLEELYEIHVASKQR